MKDDKKTLNEAIKLSTSGIPMISDSVVLPPTLSAETINSLDEETAKSFTVDEIDKQTKNSLDLEKDLEKASDKIYREIAKNVVNFTEGHLITQAKNKRELRKYLLPFIIGLLVFQLIALCAMLALNTFWLHLDNSVINTFIVSVFAETLGGLIIMIKFAFDSKQELEMIGILNSVVTNFQKYIRKHNDEDT